ncbi:ubiquitin C-terminal hydrolase L3 [Dendrothele bispora CBS 962.96]|uniref:Ubiquitin carboxyl-terminal hydrolase n=1 Tax=Dendrothele bispora (strain CBS 962.96) TaxID=1314807 RepID=A0A4S8MGH1_DENBC|nr:ubiquitin C-terminal hydrolase L3 [Dendrothele bispora CBS 962.96]
MSETRRKYYIPLESNPEVFTELIHTLGLSPELEFTDVLSLDDPDLINMMPRPVLALILAFPAIGQHYRKSLEEQNRDMNIYTGSGEDEDVIWYKQTIGNACGLYAILHSISNGPARDFITPDSPFARVLATITPLAPEERALALEASAEVEEAHLHAGKSGVTTAPDPEDDVDHHYMAFVKSHRNGRIYHLDGMRRGPVDTGVTLAQGEDVFNEGGRKLVEELIALQDDVGFSLMALVKTGD